MSDIETVWIGEAYDADGDRVARAVHINEPHCRHDIETLAECDERDVVRVEVESEPLHHADGMIPE